MKTNPFSDTLSFLFQPGWTTVIFWMLLLGSVAIAVVNWRRDERQHTLQHVWNWIFRLIIGAMWWQQSLWKLPPTYTDRPDGTGGLHYWVGEMAKWSAFSLQGDFVKNVIQPHFYFFAPQVYATEVAIAVSLMLGFFTRIGGLLGTLMAANLWLGLYRAPYEWPWTYFFLLAAQITFLVYAPGYSLGLDALRTSGGVRAVERNRTRRYVACSAT